MGYTFVLLLYFVKVQPMRYIPIKIGGKNISGKYIIAQIANI